MIRVRTPSRLHFGLLSFPEADYWPNHAGDAVVPSRRFGGVGLMVQAPGVQLSVRPAAAWTAEGPLAARALAFAEHFAQTLPAGTAQPQRLVVERAAAEHAGLGTGTQLGLAVGRALAAAAGRADLDAAELARRVGRGERSGLGVHGFERGGFLVEAGKRVLETVAPLAARLDFPRDWPIVLISPAREVGRHGSEEREAFRQLRPDARALARAEALCRLVLLGLLPALAERDFPALGEALYDFNVRAGEVFAPVQGGPYASPWAAEVVAFLRRHGVRGAGQSSWGPTLFGVAADSGQAHDLVRRLRGQFGLAEADVVVTAACNEGARLEMV